MKALILAAGRGSRLKSLTEEKPKCLMEIAGKSLLSRQLESLRGAGISEIAIVRGYLAERIQEKDVHTFHNPNWDKTNMVGSLVCASPWLEISECVVSYSDIIYSPRAVDKLKSVPDDIAITYDPNWLKLWKLRFPDPVADAETFRIDPQGKLLEIGGKITDLGDVQGQYMGLLKFRPEGWKKVHEILSKLTPVEFAKIDMTSLLRLLLKNGFPIHATPIDDPWYEVDNENDLELYRKMGI